MWRTVNFGAVGMPVRADTVGPPILEGLVAHFVRGELFTQSDLDKVLVPILAETASHLEGVVTHSKQTTDKFLTGVGIC